MIIWKRVQCWSDLEMLCGFKKNNISSCWSADKDEEDLSKLNEWIDLLDE